jgi:ABC-type multidrug transport system fused ATPase/permease subunit
MEGKTTVVIAHRFSTIQRADMILLIKGGRIIERGKHEELLRAGGLYATLYDLQFQHEDDLSNVALTGTAA